MWKMPVAFGTSENVMEWELILNIFVVLIEYYLLEEPLLTTLFKKIPFLLSILVE